MANVTIFGGDVSASHGCDLCVVAVAIRPLSRSNGRYFTTGVDCAGSSGEVNGLTRLDLLSLDSRNIT